MPHLFSPLTIKSLELKNRIVTSPMCEYSSVEGFANDWHLVHLGTRASGGAALVFTEAIAVSPEGRITFADLGIWNDAHIDKLKQITSFISSQGAIPGTQLAHAGRKSSFREPWNGGTQIASDQQNGWKALAPGSVPFTAGTEAPLELDQTGIDKIKEDFKQAAARALRAGFKVIELHAAHGYLINGFLSPLSNLRNDSYGGSFINRIRFLLEVLHAVQQEWPSELPIFVRISASEWVDGGWTADDSVALAKILREKGVDLVDCSSGGNMPDVRIPLKPGYQVEFAEKIKKETGMATGAVGLITEAEQADQIIQTGQADLIFLARQLLRDPYFPLRAAHILGHEVSWPKQYERAHWRK